MILLVCATDIQRQEKSHRNSSDVLEKANVMKGFLDCKSYQNLMSDSKNVSIDSGRTDGNLAKINFFLKNELLNMKGELKFWAFHFVFKIVLCICLQQNFEAV